MAKYTIPTWLTAVPISADSTILIIQGLISDRMYQVLFLDVWVLAFVHNIERANHCLLPVVQRHNDNVLPLIAVHFERRYADQRWLIYDARRRYGIYYDGESCSEVTLSFSEGVNSGKDIHRRTTRGKPSTSNCSSSTLRA